MILPVAAIILTIPTRKRFLARALECLKYQTYTDSPIYPILLPADPGKTIGAARNQACAIADELGAGVIIHWDDDDWSAPQRIESQLHDLAKPCVTACGYNTLLFWDSVKGETWQHRSGNARWVHGTSLCYWTSTWRSHPFPDLQTGEDLEFMRQVRPHAMPHRCTQVSDKPMIIAELHGGNTTSHVDEKAEEWSRQDWMDAFCRERMRL